MVREVHRVTPRPGQYLEVKPAAYNVNLRGPNGEFVKNIKVFPSEVRKLKYGGGGRAGGGGGGSANRGRRT